MDYSRSRIVEVTYRSKHRSSSNELMSGGFAAPPGFEFSADSGPWGQYNNKIALKNSKLTMYYAQILIKVTTKYKL